MTGQVSKTAVFSCRETPTAQKDQDQTIGYKGPKKSVPAAFR